MAADNSAAIVAAARARRDATLRRAREALRRMDETGEPISFTALAAAASVSRAWLYREPAVRAEVDRLRSQSRPGPRPPPSAERASAESIQRRLEAALADLSVLRDDNRRLREQLARRLGEHRAERTRGPG